MNASLRVEEDQTVLVRSTETKSDAANGVNKRIVLTAVDLPPDTADIDIDHVGRRIEMQIPYVLQEHGTRDSLTTVPLRRASASTRASISRNANGLTK